MSGEVKTMQMAMEPPDICRGFDCGLRREQALEQYGGFIAMPTVIPSVTMFICPRCGNMQANQNCYELTKTFIMQQSEPRIIKPAENKVVQLTPVIKR